jgi:hypothetical protein
LRVGGRRRSTCVRSATLVALLALLPAAAPAEPTGREGAPRAGPVEVVVCGPHHRVLLHWLRAASEGRLPRQGVRVVHLDAHPDLAVPEGPVPPGWPGNPGRVLRSVDIASFQLAAVRVGLVSEVWWLRPPFATQIPDGTRRFRLGAVASGLLRVDDPSDYYVLDTGYAPGQTLRDPDSLTLHVVPLDGALGSPPPAPDGGATILDIDLDAFATHNPAADRLRAAGLGDAQLDALRRIFARENLVLSDDPETRVREVDSLLDAARTLAEGPLPDWPGALATLWRRGLGPLDLASLARLLGTLDGVPLERLLEDGRTLVGAPEHLEPAPGEIAASARRLGDLIRHGWVDPALVTIARSVDDGFTPRRYWPEIEWTVLHELADALGDATLRFDAGQRPAPRPHP